MVSEHEQTALAGSWRVARARWSHPSSLASLAPPDVPLFGRVTRNGRDNVEK